MGAALMIALGVASCDGDSETAEPNSDSTGDERKISLRYASINDPNHFVTVNLEQPFVNAVQELSDGAIDIEFFPSQQLGAPADQVTALQTGVADIGYVSPSYNGAQMPTGDVFALPRLAPSPETLTEAYYSVIMNADSIVRRSDFEQNEIVPLAAAALPLYQMVTAERPIESARSFEGLKVRSSGATQDLIVESLGGTPVAIDGPAQYEALQRGTVDAGMFNLPSLISNRTMEVTKYATTNANVSSFLQAIAISASSWDGLTDDEREILLEAGRRATDTFIDYLMGQAADTAKRLEDEGLTLVELSEDETAYLDEVLGSVQEDWAKQLDANGVDGSGALQEAREAVEQTE